MRTPFLAVAVAAALLAPVGAQATHQLTEPVLQGLGWLRSVQASDGHVADTASTAWSAIAFARAGIDPASVARPGGTSLEAAVVSDTTPGLSANGLARQILALVASGADPRSAAGFDAVAALQATFDGTQLGDPVLVNDDIFGLQALHAAGIANDDPTVRGVRAFILSQQSPSGAWSFGTLSPSNPDVLFAVTFFDSDTTAQALVALLATGSAPTDPAIIRGTLWLKASQGIDGGCTWNPLNIGLSAFAIAASAAAGDAEGAVFHARNGFGGNTDSTAWVTMGVVALGQDPDSPGWTAATGASLTDFIAAMQAPDGHFLFQIGTESYSPASTTAYAVVALLGHTFLE